MQQPVFDELFALLSTVPLSGNDLSRLRAWIAGIHDPAECLALIEAAAAGRPCPHCTSRRMRRSGFASGLQRQAPRNQLRARLPAGRARDRNGLTLDFHTGRGPVTAAKLRHCLQPVLPSDVLLVSDSAGAYASFASAAGITHEAIDVRAGVRARGAIHVQNVNGWHSRFKSWLARFKGVASRYLAHYLNWQRLLDARNLQTPAQWLCAAVGQT
jgi:hypothetical protein